MASPADIWNSPAHLHTSNPQNTSHSEHLSVNLYPHGAFSLSAISLRAACLGFVCAFALNLAWAFRDSYPQLPFFVALLSFFHFIEYWITAEYNTRRAKVEAFILSSNGIAYNIAHVSAMVEGLLELYFAPSWKKHTSVTLLGLALVVLGQVVRTLAMKHAGSNFCHQVLSRKEEGHVLVKGGIYSCLRHPSYFGYFWWAIGTQLMLGNPVCTLGFAGFLWKFFSARIKREYCAPPPRVVGFLLTWVS